MSLPHDLRTALLLLACLMILGYPSSASSDKQVEGMGLIQRAMDLTDLDQSGPYQLETDVWVADAAVGERTGTDLVRFSSPALWRRDLHVTGYDEVAVFMGHRMYRSRSLKFTPPSVALEITGDLRNIPEARTYKVLRLFDKEVGGAKSRCVYLEQRGGNPPGEVKWCFDAVSGLPTLHITWRGSREIRFSDYKAFRDKFVPGVIEETIRGKRNGKVVLKSISPGIIDPPNVFQPPVGAVVRPWCDNMDGLRVISMPAFPIPPGARAHRGLEMNYEVTVDAEGNVIDVVPMAPSDFVDKIVVPRIRSSKWSPAICDGQPVPTNTWIDLPSFFRW